MNVRMRKVRMQGRKKYEKDLDLLLSLVIQKGQDPFGKEKKTSMLYALEAEEIDLKSLEEDA
jgi:hypothetical protein